MPCLAFPSRCFGPFLDPVAGIVSAHSRRRPHERPAREAVPHRGQGRPGGGRVLGIQSFLVPPRARQVPAHLLPLPHRVVGRRVSPLRQRRPPHGRRSCGARAPRLGPDVHLIDRFSHRADDALMEAGRVVGRISPRRTPWSRSSGSRPAGAAAQRIKIASVHQP